MKVLAIYLWTSLMEYNISVEVIAFNHCLKQEAGWSY